MSAGKPTAAPDTLIVGAGIIGLSLAYELAKRGQSVTVIDQNQYGRAASWAGVGILPPVAQRNRDEPLEELRWRSHRLLAEWSSALKNETGIDPGYRQCGGIYVATTSGEAATLAANQLWWAESGIEAHRWTSNELAEHQQPLAQLAHSGKLKAIWWLPEECQLRTPRYVRALAAACRQRGVSIVESSKVTQITTQHDQASAASADGNRVVAIETDCGRMSADQYCVAAGPWTRALLEPLGITSGILPIRGQVLLYHPPTQLLSCIINEGHRYLVPRADGRVLVGSNEEEVGFVCETTEPIVADLKNWAGQILPELKTLEVERAWAGLRPGSFDSYPYIGRLPGCNNLYVAAGHYRAGIHLSAGTAQVLADLITTGRTDIDMTSFRPGRG